MKYLMLVILTAMAAMMFGSAIALYSIFYVIYYLSIP